MLSEFLYIESNDPKLSIVLTPLGANIIFSVAIAWFSARKRIIGFWWSLFFCTTLTFLIGYLVTRQSPVYSVRTAVPSAMKLLYGFLCLALALYFSANLYQHFHENGSFANFGDGITKANLIVSLVGGSIYSFWRSRGVSFNSK